MAIKILTNIYKKATKSQTNNVMGTRGETRIQGCKLYLNVTSGRGPGPRWRGGAILAPHRRGRRLQGVSLIKHSILISSQLDPALTD
jgi:hypothetical protein